MSEGRLTKQDLSPSLAQEIDETAAQAQDLETRSEELATQLAQNAYKTEGDISVLEFENLKVPINEGYDWSPAIVEGINQAVLQKKRLLMPPFPTKSRLIALENIDGLTVEFLAGSQLLAINDLESYFLSLKSCKNIIINNFNCDGQYTYYRGFLILDGNEEIHLNNPVIKNISPKIVTSNPRNTNSVGLFISTHNNRRIFINNVLIDGVKNNDNGIIGDSIGSSRGILFEPPSGTTVVRSHTIRVRGVDIKNIVSEDGDGIQFIGGGIEHDIEVRDIVMDNTKRRALKFQSIKGVKIDGIVVRQTDRSYEMVAGISLLTSGNTVKNIDMNIKSKKGIEFNPNVNDDFKTNIHSAKIVLTNDTLIDDSRTYPIDILDLGTGTTANNLTIDNVDLLGANEGIIIRSYTRNLKINGVKQRSYGNNMTAIVMSFKPPVTPASDGSNVSHRNMAIANVESDAASFYANNDTSFENCYLGNSIARDGTDPYRSMVYHRGIQIYPRTFMSTNLPVSGTYSRGDYVKNPLPSRTWNNESATWSVVWGWRRLTTGDTHILGTDWVEDKTVYPNAT